jgi:hypothetical protein
MSEDIHRLDIVRRFKGGITLPDPQHVPGPHMYTFIAGGEYLIFLYSRAG